MCFLYAYGLKHSSQGQVLIPELKVLEHREEHDRRFFGKESKTKPAFVKVSLSVTSLFADCLIMPY